MNDNINIVNRTNADISMHDAEFNAAYHNGFLADDLADLFEVTFLTAYNDDGTDRMLIDFA